MADTGPGQAIRQAGPAALAQALQAARRDTLATFAAFERALPGLAVPCRPTLNPPLWELGHIGWFQAWWTLRNPQWMLGLLADPAATRRAADPPGADTLYDSSRVAHGRRWQLALPDVAATRAQLAAQLQRTLALLRDLPDAADDAALYFFRLALLHEDMHHEAALMMAQALGVPLDDSRWQPAALGGERDELSLPGGSWTLGRPAATPGFAFDNECGTLAVALDGFRIDRRTVAWAEYLPFVEAGGYRDARWWDAAGAAWLAQADLQAPQALRRGAGGGWERRLGGRWAALDGRQAACHLSAHEARAWCAWAGRRLPTEAEWECAALTCPDGFAWGQVWEWTASPFAPFPGFAPHPYRDYSAPWFDGRPVLRGASFGTQPRMHHARYRNFFTADRHDVFAGFRSCAR